MLTELRSIVCYFSRVGVQTSHTVRGLNWRAKSMITMNSLCSTRTEGKLWGPLIVVRSRATNVV